MTDIERRNCDIGHPVVFLKTSMGNSWRWLPTTSPQVAKTYRFVTVTEFQTAYARLAKTKANDAADVQRLVNWMQQSYPVCANFWINAIYLKVVPCFSSLNDMRWTANDSRPNFATLVWINDAARIRHGSQVKISKDNDGNLIDPLRIGLTRQQYEYLEMT